MKLEIHTYGDPVLREKADRIETFDDALQELAQAMLKKMYADDGVGLAAQQVGLTKSICVIDIPPEADMDDQGHRLNPDIKMPLVMINPQIEEKSDDTSSTDEGCLSFPGIFAAVSRSNTIQLNYQDTSGVSHAYTVQGFLARAMQHEIDHLNGVLFIDHISHVKKIAIGGKLKRLKKETLANLSNPRPL
jgi:peptide deformylase